MREATENEVAVGQRLRAARQAQGLSLHEMGELVGYSYQQVAKYETAENSLRVETLLAFAAVLKVRPVDLLPKGDADTELVRILRELVKQKPGRLLLRAWETMDGRQRRALALIADGIWRKNTAGLAIHPPPAPR